MSGEKDMYSRKQHKELLEASNTLAKAIDDNAKIDASVELHLGNLLIKLRVVVANRDKYSPICTGETPRKSSGGGYINTSGSLNKD